MPWGIAAAAVVGAVSADQQSKAARSAASEQAAASERAGEVQAEAADRSVEEQRRQFDISQAQAEPFRQAELASLQQREPIRAQALEQQAALLGIGGQQAQEQAFRGLQESPSQQFIRERQERTLLRNQAAIGGLGGGNIRTALQQQAAGFAQQDLQNQLSRLGGFTGAQGVGTTTNLAQLGAQQAANVGNLLQQRGAAQAGGLIGAGEARASGTLGAQAAQSKFLSGLAGSFGGGAFR